MRMVCKYRAAQISKGLFLVYNRETRLQGIFKRDGTKLAGKIVAPVYEVLEAYAHCGLIAKRGLLA